MWGHVEGTAVVDVGAEVGSADAADSSLSPWTHPPARRSRQRLPGPLQQERKRLPT